MRILPIGNRGFTLLETVATLFLLSLLAALVFPAFSRAPGGLAWRMAGDMLARDLKTARDTALAGRRTTAMVFTGDGYTVFLGFGEPISHTFPAGITLKAYADGRPVETLTFAPGGGDRAVVELAAGRKKAVIRLEEDGRVVRE